MPSDCCFQVRDLQDKFRQRVAEAQEEVQHLIDMLEPLVVTVGMAGGHVGRSAEPGDAITATARQKIRGIAGCTDSFSS